MKKSICVVMAVLMSNAPCLALAATSDEMIPTSMVVEQLTRAEAEQKIVEIVSSVEVREKLASLGITPQEVSGRLASLSDTELRQMSSQMQQARYGGDAVIGLLVLVVLVLLIIFLAKRV